jgi:hypothetical protein
MAGPVLVAGGTGDALLDACRSAQFLLDCAELAFCCGRRECGNTLLDRAASALDCAL